MYLYYFNLAATSSLVIPCISEVIQVALAVPSMIFIAQAKSLAFKLGIF